MSGGGSSGNTTTTTQTKLPKFANDALRFGKDRITDLYDMGNPPYTDMQTLAPFDTRQRNALSRITTQANQGLGPVANIGMNEAAGTLRGDYLGNYDAAMGSFSPNAFNDAVMALADPALRSATSGFEAAGRTRSGLADEAQTDAIARAYAGLYDSERNRRAGLYDSERDRMMKTGAMLPQYEQLAYMPHDRLLAAGDRTQQQQQAQLEDEYSRWQRKANLPYQRVDDYIQRIQGIVPGQGYGSTQQRTPTTSNPAMSALGGGLAGYQLAGALPAAMGINPLFGAGAGALIGLLS